MAYFIGIDMGGTSVQFGLFNDKEELIDRSSIPTTKGPGPTIMMDWIDSHIQKILAKEDLKRKDLKGIGVGVPGPVVDQSQTEVLVNLGWGEVDIKELFSRHFSCPIFVANDANLAALGEAWLGAGRAYDNLVMLTLGTGVGGGVILNNHLLEGKHGAAGEIGHLPFLTKPSERACGCGRHDCLELCVSATGIVARTKDILDHTLESSILRHDYDRLTSKIIFAAAGAGDSLAEKVVDETAYDLGRALSIIGSILDPDCFVIGGGVSSAGDTLLHPTRTYYKEFAFANTGDTPILAAELGSDAGTYGAARLAIQQV